MANNLDAYYDANFNAAVGLDSPQPEIADSSSLLSQLKTARLKRRADEKYIRNGVNYNPNQSAILRQGLSDAKSRQIYTEYLPNGQVFKYQLDPETGEKIPWNGGDTRNLYIANSLDGGYKLGLARNDLSEASRLNGITPFKARYMDKTGLFGLGYNSPYSGTGGTYDGTPGRDGVNPHQDPLLDIELPYDLATDYERQVHTSSGQIKNRLMGQGAVDYNDIFNFGAGKSEYTSADAPLWNENYVEDGIPIALDTPIPGQYDNSLGNYEEEDTFEFVDAFQSAAVQLGGRFAKLAGEVTGDVANSFRDVKQLGDNALETWGKKVVDNADEYTGYNPKDLQLGTRQIQDSFREFDRGDMLSGAVSLVRGMVNAGPQVVASSLPEVLGIAGASALTGGTGAVAAIGTLAATNANDTLDKREKLNGGREANADEIAAVMAAETLATMLDYGAFKFITKAGVPKIQFKGQKGEMGMDEALKKYFPEVDSVVGKKELLNALGRTVSRGAGHGMTETVQESTTEAIRTLAAELGTDEHLSEDWVQNLDRNKFNILTSGALGFSGGVGFGAIQNTRETAKDVSNVLGQINEDKRAYTAATNIETTEEAENIAGIRNLDKQGRIDTFTEIYPQAQAADKAETVEELVEVAVKVAAAVPNERGQELAKLILELRKPDITDKETQQKKVQLQQYIEDSLDSLSEEGRQANRDAKFIEAGLEDDIFGEMVETPDTESTTYVDEEGQTKAKYTGEGLQAEIEKTEGRKKLDSENLAEAEAEAAEELVDDTQVIKDAEDDKDLSVTYVDEDGNVQQKYSDAELGDELQSTLGKIAALEVERGTVTAFEIDGVQSKIEGQRAKASDLRFQIDAIAEEEKLLTDSLATANTLKDIEGKTARIAEAKKVVSGLASSIKSLEWKISNNTTWLKSNPELTKGSKRKKRSKERLEKQSSIDKNREALDELVKAKKEADAIIKSSADVAQEKRKAEKDVKSQAKGKKEGRKTLSDEPGAKLGDRIAERRALEDKLEKATDPDEIESISKELEAVGQEILDTAKSNAEARRKAEDEKEAPVKEAKGRIAKAVSDKVGKGTATRIARLESKLNKLTEQQDAEKAIAELEEAVKPTDPDIKIADGFDKDALDAEVDRIWNTIIPEGIEPREINSESDLIRLANDINTEIAVKTHEMDKLQTNYDFGSKSKADKAALDKVTAEVEYLTDHMKNLVKIQAKAAKVAEISKALDESPHKTIGEFIAAYREKFKEQLAPDESNQEVVDKQVQSEKSKAKRVTSDTKGFVKKVLSKTDRSEGSAETLKAEFIKRINKLSNKAIKQLMSEENIADLVTAYKATDGGTQMDATFFTRALNSKLKGREASKKHYGIGDTIKGASGKGTEAVIYGQIRKAHSVVTKLVTGNYDKSKGSEEQTELIDEYTIALQDILKAVKDLPIGSRREYANKLLGDIGGKGDSTGLWFNFLEANPDTAHVAKDVQATIDKIIAQLDAEESDPATTRKFLMDTARSHGAELQEDIDLARTILDEQSSEDFKGRKITPKEKRLLTKMLDNLEDRSAQIMKEVKERSNKEDAIIHEANIAAINADPSITEVQKEFYENLPPDRAAQFGLDSLYKDEQGIAAVEDLTGLPYAEATKQIEIDCP